MEEGTVVTPPPQTVPAIRKKGNFRKIPELLPAIAFYAMGNGILPTRPSDFVIHEHRQRSRSSEG